MRARGLPQVRHAEPRDQEDAACIDLMHQVVALHVCIRRAGQTDRGGIVDANIDPAETIDHCVDGGGHRVLMTKIDDRR
jgi:hypothetical protein